MSLSALVFLILFAYSSRVCYADEDFKFRWIIPPTNYRGRALPNGNAIMQSEKDGPWKLYDKSGKVIKVFSDVDTFGLIRKGEKLIDFTVNHKQGFINLSGDVVVPPVLLNSMPEYGDGLISETIRNEHGIQDGFVSASDPKKWVIQPIFTRARGFSEGLAPVAKRVRWGYVDKTGKMVIDFLFYAALPFKNGSAIVEVRPSFARALIDRNGKFLLEPHRFDYIDIHRDGPIGVVKDGKVGFVDDKGDLVIDFKYKYKSDEYSSCFNDGLATVIIDDDNEGYKRIVINEKGEKVFDINVDIDFSSTYIGNYIAGRCKDDTYYIINRQGDMFNVSNYVKGALRKVIKPAYDNVFIVCNFNNEDEKIGIFEILPKKK
jgi:hypothetical protein